MQAHNHGAVSDSANGGETPRRYWQRDRSSPFTLVELEPGAVLSGRSTETSFMSKENADFNGQTREACPYCGDVSLKLALRSERVSRAHLYCEKCTRCFDALFSDGSPALSFSGRPEV